MRVNNLLATAEADQYKKDLTPSTVAGVRMNYSWYLPAGSTSTQGFLGVGLINDSLRQWTIASDAGETQEALLSPLDNTGRYLRWHGRRVHGVANPGEAGYTAPQQLADNRSFMACRGNRKLFTVDDTYFLVLDTEAMGGNTVNFVFSIELWLKKP